MTDLFDTLTPTHTSNLPAPANQARYQTQAKANHQALILPPISTAHSQPPRRSVAIRTIRNLYDTHPVSCVGKYD
jgi:hypothetical protein